MEALRPADYENVLRAVEILGSDLTLESFPSRAVDAVTAVIEVDLISYSEVDMDAGTNRFLVKPDPTELALDGPEYARFVRRYAHHPIVARRVSQSEARGRATPFFASGHRLRLVGIVGNCCGQAEIRLNLGVTLAKASRLVGIAINRSYRDFDDHDAAMLEALRPHLVAAYRNANRFAEEARPKGKTALPSNAVDNLPLTRRESEVLYWVSMGKTNEEVSEILGARPTTVKKHLEHIYDKLGVPNRTAAARFGTRQALPT